MDRDVLKSAGIRAARTFIQVFLTVYLAGVLGQGTDGTLSSLLNLSLLDQSAFAGIAALLSFVHRSVLDPSDVPSLPDTEATTGIPADKR